MIREDIRERFAANLARVKNIQAIYESTSRLKGGRRGVQEVDLLRAAVVLLHASLEDVLRSVAEWKLPAARPDALAEIPLAGTKRGARVGLEELATHRGRTVDDVIADSVREYLERSNYNHPGDIKTILEKVELDPKLADPYAVELAAMMTRRHWIAHRADRNPQKGTGHHPAKSLPNAVVSRWIEAVEKFCADVHSHA